MARKGLEHERAHLRRLERAGRAVEVIDVDGGELEVAATLTERAMRSGAETIYQGAFVGDRWRGRADFLERVERPTALGAWGYEAVDTKLSRAQALPHHALQLAVYSQAIERAQGEPPERMHVELGSGRRDTIRVADVGAYVRRAQASLRGMLRAGPRTEPYPCPHCGFCAFLQHCEAEWRTGDHLSYVAGISRAHVQALVAAGIGTLGALAGLEAEAVVPGMRCETVETLRRQASLQARARATGTLPVEDRPAGAVADRGLARLPRPDEGDVFLDLEGDPFWEPDRELTFLFGIVFRDAGEWRYRAFWGHDLAGERRAFEEMVDALFTRLDGFPDMHVYHYSPAEPSAITRLAATYGTREEEVDRLLRGAAFVDLFTVTRQGLVVGAEGYGLKVTERLAGFTRAAALGSGSDAVLVYERWRASGEQAELDAIAAYNEEDCRATLALRDWLVDRRPPGLAWWAPSGASEPSDQTSAWRAEVATLRSALVEGREPGTSRWLAGELLEYHRREARPAWWQWFARLGMDDDELLDDAEAVSGLEPTGRARWEERRSVLDELRFPPQEHKLSPGGGSCDPRTQKGITIDTIDTAAGRLVISRGKARRDEPLPTALVPGKPFDTLTQQRALFRLGESVRSATGAYPALEAVLERRRPRVRGRRAGDPLQTLDLDEQLALVRALDESHLVVQGPPGTGKTWLAGRMAADLVSRGERVGLMAVSHKAINNLIGEVLAAADEHGVAMRIARKVTTRDHRYEGDDRVVNLESPSDCEDDGFQVVAGTSWLFSREAWNRRLGHLLVDEAGQMALADALAAGTAARNLVFLGDPLQLPQVSQAVHPPGTSASVLEHLLGEHATVPEDRGIFLAVTRRLHPDVCRFVSREIYEDRLTPHACCSLRTTGAGTGIRFLPVTHRDRGSRSPEEAEAVRSELDRLFELGVAPEDVMVVAPYNAQVRTLKEALPATVRIGTVDRFQGQEAPVVFFSMATSSGDDLPRDVGFTFSRNRLNVAISRAQCLAYLVCSPALLEARARDVEEMRLISTLCALVEEAELQTWAAA